MSSRRNRLAPKRNNGSFGFVRLVSLFLARPPAIGHREEKRQGKLEPWKKRRPVDFAFRNHHISRVLAAGGQRPPEAIDDPVLANPGGKILGALLAIIAHAVAFPLGDEFDDDRRNILAGIRG